MWIISIPPGALSVHIAETRKMFQKHKVPEKLVRKKIRDARRSYLKQSLYNNEFDRLINEFLSFNARRGWREKYK